MEKLIFTHRKYRNYVFVDWDMSSVCNYDCHYCNEEIHDGKVKFPDIDVAKKLVDKINLEYDGVKDYAYFNLLGGEPTIWKHFEEFSNYVKKDNKKNLLQILTNGSRSLSWWKLNAQFIDKAIVSVHVANCDIKKLVSKFNQIVNEIDIDFQLCMDITIFDKCLDYYNYAYDNLDSKIKLRPKALKILLGGRDLMPYTNEQKRIMQNLPETHGNQSREYGSQMMQDDKPVDIVKLITNEENNWENWACWIGIDSINITRYGDVKIGSWCNPHLILGNINNNLDFKIPMKPVRCTYNTCGCLADVHTTKKKYYDGEMIEGHFRAT